MKMLPKNAKIGISFGNPQDREKEMRRKLTRREKPCQREQVGGEGSGENVETDGSSSRRVEFVSWVVLTSVVDVSSPITSTDLLSQSW